MPDFTRLDGEGEQPVSEDFHRSQDHAPHSGSVTSGQPESATDKTCGGCEYFDRHYGDCLRSNSPRFQAEPDSPACHLFYPDTTAALEVENADA